MQDYLTTGQIVNAFANIHLTLQNEEYGEYCDSQICNISNNNFTWSTLTQPNSNDVITGWVEYVDDSTTFYEYASLM